MESIEQNPKEEENARWDLEEKCQGLQYPLCF